MAIKRIAFILGVLIVLGVSIRAILTKTVSKANTTLVNGTFYGIEKVVNRGSVSYTVYLAGNQEHYTISANNSECFAYSAFTNKVTIGQPISLYVNDNAILSKSLVVSIIADGQEYLSFGCINQDIADNKFKIPLMSTGVFLLLIMVVRLKTNKKLKKSIFS